MPDIKTVTGGSPTNLIDQIKTSGGIYFVVWGENIYKLKFVNGALNSTLNWGK